MDANALKEKLSYSPSTGKFTWLKNGRRAGCLRKDGYFVIRIDDVLLYAHRLAWLYVHDKEPSGVIDHINGMRGDNRIQNLRDVSQRVNSENCRILEKTSNLSGFRGVQKNHAGWQAMITVHGVRKGLGTYATPEDAHAVYLHAKRLRHEGCTV